MDYYQILNRAQRLCNGITSAIIDRNADEERFAKYLSTIEALREEENVSLNLLTIFDHAEQAIEIRLSGSNFYEARSKAIAEIGSASVIINKLMWA